MLTYNDWTVRWRVDFRGSWENMVRDVFRVGEFFKEMRGIVLDVVKKLI